MSDRLVTVASYAFIPEAQVAKNLLELEGIPAVVSGELIADVLAGAMAQAKLQVRAEDAQRAVSLLAEAEAQASLAEDWETQAENGLWTCPVCGTALLLGDTVCSTCSPTNRGITTDRLPCRTDFDRGPTGSGPVKKGDEIQGSSPRSPLPAPEAGDASGPPHGGAGCVVLLFFFSWLWLLWWV